MLELTKLESKGYLVCCMIPFHVKNGKLLVSIVGNSAHKIILILATSYQDWSRKNLKVRLVSLLVSSFVSVLLIQFLVRWEASLEHSFDKAQETSSR